MRAAVDLAAWVVSELDQLSLIGGGEPLIERPGLLLLNEIPKRTVRNRPLVRHPDQITRGIDPADDRNRGLRVCLGDMGHRSLSGSVRPPVRATY